MVIRGGLFWVYDNKDDVVVKITYIVVFVMSLPST